MKNHKYLTVAKNPRQQRAAFAAIQSVLLVAVSSTMLLGVLGYFKDGLMSRVQGKVSVCLNSKQGSVDSPTGSGGGITIAPRRSSSQSVSAPGGSSPAGSSSGGSSSNQPEGMAVLRDLSEVELREMRMSGPSDLEKLKQVRIGGTDLLTLLEVAANHTAKRGTGFASGVARHIHEPVKKANFVLGAYNTTIDAVRFRRDPNLDTGTDLLASGGSLAGSVSGSPHLAVASASFSIGKTMGGAIMGTKAVGVFFLKQVGFSEADAIEAVKMTKGY